MRKRTAVITGVIAVVVAAAAVFGTVAAKPAEAFPNKAQACSNCHGSATSGSVTATPSKTTLSPGEAYTVNVSITFPAGGQYGAWVTNGTGTPSAGAYAGPGGADPVSVDMTAPTTAGTYNYTAWGVKGKPGAGQTGSGTYQITVQSSGGGGGGTTVAPTTVAPNAASVKKGKTATLKFQVNDSNSGATTATVTIQVKNAAGKVIKTINAGAKPVNALQSTSFKCTLKKGKYKFYVSAKDALGNAAGNVAFNSLKVK